MSLGVEHFSLDMHQPHPPGYPLLIGLARLFALFLPAHASVLAVSSLLAAFAVGVLYQLTLRLWGKHWLAFVSAAGLAFNPLFWFYRQTALSYTADALASLAVGSLSYRALKSDGRYCLVAGFVLGLLGGFRPSLVGLLFLMPLIAPIVHRNLRLLLGTIAVIVVGVLVWLVPMLALVGGPLKYWESTRSLAALGTRRTSIFFAGSLEAPLEQLHLLAESLMTGLIFVLPVAILGAWLWKAGKVGRRTSRSDLLLAACWILPPLFVFSLIHLGQVGYLLLLVPLPYLLAAPAWLAASCIEGRWKRPALLALVLLWIGQALVFPLASSQIVRLGMGPIAVRLHALASFNAQVLRDNDVWIDSLTRIVQSYPSDRTIVLCGGPLTPLRSPLSQPNPFRTLGTTCPQYLLVNVDQRWLLSLRGRRTGYPSANCVSLEGIDCVVFLFAEIPAAKRPEGLELIRREAFGRTYFEARSPGSFRFLGGRFEEHSAAGAQR